LTEFTRRDTLLNKKENAGYRSEKLGQIGGYNYWMNKVSDVTGGRKLIKAGESIIYLNGLMSVWRRQARK